MRISRSGLPNSIAKSILVSLVIFVLLLPVHATFTLDPTFAGAGGGRLTISFPDSSNGYSSSGQRIFVQPNGRIVAAGQFTNASPDGQMTGVAIVGLLPGGTVDPAFATTLDWQPFGFTSLRDALMYPDGRILRLSQFFTVTGSSTAKAVRYDVNGGVDNTFTSNASIGAPPGGFGTVRPAQVAVRSDGKVLVLIRENGEFFLYRLNPDGTRDTTYGSNGVLSLRFNRIFQPSQGDMEMIALPDGKVLIVGPIAPVNFPEGSSEFFVARLTETGNWDKTFGRVGLLTIAFGPGMTGLVQDAVLQPDGKILLCGSVASGDLDVWMMRLQRNGRPDPTFGTAGVTIRDFSPAQQDSAMAIALSADGKIRLAGRLGATPNFLVARFSANGAFEEHTSFEFTPGQYASANDIRFQPDGKLVVIGETRNPNTAATTGSVFAIARLTE